MSKCLKLSLILLAMAAAAAAQQVSAGQPPLFNPYERPKNGPPLTKVFHKVETSWLLRKLRDPKHHPSARMPDFQFTEEEALDIMAYLKSIAGEPLPVVQWPAWAAKDMEEMEDDEFEAMLELSDRGKAVWSNARCTVCHAVNGPGGVIGGFVDLRVGGIDLQIAASKLKRDWLYTWLEEPARYFPDTLMPRFRFSEAEIKALTEYMLRDDAFLPFPEEEEEEEVGEEDTESAEHWAALEEPERVSRGERLIELSRCVLCHEIEGIPELLPRPELSRPAAGDSFEFLAYELRCLSCHSIEGRGGTYAPDLSGEGSRLREPWIAKFVESPDMIRPLSQQMPKFNLTAREAKTIASYLSKERRDVRIPAQIPGGAVGREEIQRGRETFQAKGCISCHTVADGPGGGLGPDLALAADRLRPGYVWFTLKNPHAVNPYSAEPDYGLSDDEARALTGYLLRGAK